jgi:hypothetical protein
MVGIREVPEDWVYSSIVEHLSSMLKALGVIPSITTKEERERERENPINKLLPGFFRNFQWIWNCCPSVFNSYAFSWQYNLKTDLELSMTVLAVEERSTGKMAYKEFLL